jgi:hypothetical protein
MEEIQNLRAEQERANLKLKADITALQNGETQAAAAT